MASSTGTVLLLIIFFVLFLTFYAYRAQIKEEICKHLKEGDQLARLLKCPVHGKLDGGGGGEGGEEDRLYNQDPNTNPGGVTIGEDGREIAIPPSYGGRVATGPFIGSKGGLPSYSPPSRPITSRLPAPAPLSGTYSPLISAVNIRYDTGIMTKPGWYKVEVKAYWKSCGENSNTYIHPYPHYRLAAYDSEGNLIGVYDIIVGASSGGAMSKTCFTWKELQDFAAKHCGGHVAPENIFACRAYRVVEAEIARGRIKVTDKTVICPLVSSTRGLTWYVDRSTIEKLAGDPCGTANDYLIVKSRLLYCGGEDSTSPPSSCQPFTRWVEQVNLRVDLLPPSTPEKRFEYEWGGLDFLEVNGRVFAIIPMSSILGDAAVIDLNALGFSLVLAGLITLAVRFVLRRRWGI